MKNQPHRRPVAVAAALMCTLAAQAQVTGPSTQPPVPENQTVQNIVVTAQKREQAAIDVPASVSTVNAERLQRSGALRIEDYAAQLPGLSITSLSRGSSAVVLRGISTGISSATPPTAFYIDEAPIGSITSYAAGTTLTPDLDPYDLRRIEVLKGPQGTLYGAGAVGGLLRYVTVPADPDRFGGAVSLGGHKIAKGGNGHEARASINVPLVNKALGLRVSLLDRDEAGFIDDPLRGLEDVNQATTRGGRIALDWKISPDWSLQTWALTQRFHTTGIGAHDLNGPALTPETGDLQRSSNVAEVQKRNLDVFNATLKGRAGAFDLVSSTTHQKILGETTVDVSRTLGAVFSAVLGIPNIGVQTHQIINTERWSQELRARSTAFADKLEYEVGYFYTKEDSTNRLPPGADVFVNPGQQPLPLPPLFDAMLGVKYEEHSFFGNATYAFSPQFDLMGGIRLARDKQDFVQDYRASLGVPAPVAFTQSVSNDTTTWLLSGRYKPDANTAIYGRVATGYRPGGPSALPASVGKPSFEPDTLTSFEIGYKAALAGGKASIEAAIFTTDWKDVQVQRATVANGVTYQHFVNAGKAKSQGAEATLLLFPTSGLTLRATAAYTDSKLTEDAPVVGGLNGDRMPFVPEWTASLAADYRFALAGYPAWVGGALGYIGERRSNFSQQANAIGVPAYHTLGLNAGMDFGGVRVAVYGKNLTDERGINFLNTTGSVSPANPVGNPYTSGVIQPRTLGVDVSYRF